MRRGKFCCFAPTGVDQEGKGWRRIGHAAGLHGIPHGRTRGQKATLWWGWTGRTGAVGAGYREWELLDSGRAGKRCGFRRFLTSWQNPVGAGTMAGLGARERRRGGIRWSKVQHWRGFSFISPHSPGWRVVDRRRASPGSAIRSAKWARFSGLARRKACRAVWRLRCISIVSNGFGWEPTRDCSGEGSYKRFVRVSQVPFSIVWAIARLDGTVGLGIGWTLLVLWRTGGVLAGADGLSNQDVLSLGAGATEPYGWVFRSGGIDRVHPRANGLAVDKQIQRPGTNGLVYFFGFRRPGTAVGGHRARRPMVGRAPRWKPLRGNTRRRVGLGTTATEMPLPPSGRYGVDWNSGGLARFMSAAAAVAAEPLRWSSPVCSWGERRFWRGNASSGIRATRWGALLGA